MGFWSLAVNRSTRGLRGTWGEKLGEGWVRVFDVAPENQAAVKMRVRKGFVVATGIATSVVLADAFGLAADALDHGANLMDIFTGMDHADTAGALLPSPDGAFPDDSFCTTGDDALAFGGAGHVPGDGVRFGDIGTVSSVTGDVVNSVGTPLQDPLPVRFGDVIATGYNPDGSPQGFENV